MPDTTPHAEPSITPLLQQLANDGLLWANAELSLARSEFRVMRRRYIAAALFAVSAIILAAVAIIVITQTAVAAAGLYMGNEVLGGIAVAIFLIIFCLLSIIGVRRMLHWKKHSFIFRTFTS